MELSKMIEELLNSGILENMELATTLLRSPEVSDEEKKKFVDKFIEDYLCGEGDILSDEHRNLFKNWVELYLETKKKK